MRAKKFRVRIPPPATLSLQSLQNKLLAVVVQAVRRGTGFQDVQALGSLDIVQTPCLHLFLAEEDPSEHRPHGKSHLS